MQCKAPDRIVGSRIRLPVTKGRPGQPGPFVCQSVKAGLETLRLNLGCIGAGRVGLAGPVAGQGAPAAIEGPDGTIGQASAEELSAQEDGAAKVERVSVDPPIMWSRPKTQRPGP